MEQETPAFSTDNILLSLLGALVIFFIEGVILYLFRYKRFGHSLVDAIVINLVSGIFLVVVGTFSGWPLIVPLLVPVIEILVLTALADKGKRDIRVVVAPLVMNIPYLAGVYYFF